MPRHSKGAPCGPKPRAFGLGLLLLVGLGLGLAPAPTRAQSLIPGVDEWAEAATQGTSKWGGSRVPFPTPAARPQLPGRLDSLSWPLSVHTAEAAPWPRARRLLAALEAAYSALYSTGWALSFGDGGQGGSAGYDVYLVPTDGPGTAAKIDATEPMWALDAVRAFVLFDPRLPESRVETCAVQGLAEAMLYEFDPAEADSLRRSSAAYLAYLVTGELGCDPEENDLRRSAPELAPLGPESGARGAAWLMRLGSRLDAGTSTFLRDMWQFARQRTWEGVGLRASPDLFEAMAATLSADHQLLENIAAELAEQEAVEWLRATKTAEPERVPRAKPPWTRLSWSKLPRYLPPALPIEPLGSAHLFVEIDTQLLDGDRIRVWSRGEYGARWSLSVTTLDSELQVLTRMGAPARKTPDSYLSVTLPKNTRSVLISVTNLADGTPDADEGANFEVRSVAITVDRGDAKTDAADAENTLF